MGRLFYGSEMTEGGLKRARGWGRAAAGLIAVNQSRGLYQQQVRDGRLALSIRTRTSQDKPGTSRVRRSPISAMTADGRPVNPQIAVASVPLFCVQPARLLLIL